MHRQYNLAVASIKVLPEVLHHYQFSFTVFFKFVIFNNVRENIEVLIHSGLKTQKEKESCVKPVENCSKLPMDCT